jgi:hypothetical protein
MDLNGDVTGFRDNEFLDFDVNPTGSKLAENQFRNIDGQRFQKLPRPALAEAEQPLADSVIIDGVTQVITRSGQGEVGFHFNADKEALGMDPFFVRNADVVTDLKIFNCDDVHK